MSGQQRIASATSDEWGDDSIDDSDLFGVEASHLYDDFKDIDQYDIPDALAQAHTRTSGNASKRGSTTTDTNTTQSEPRRLENGNWECNHRCKDKLACKHLCCKDGTENKPKMPKPKDSNPKVQKDVQHTSGKTQTKLNMTIAKPTTLAIRSLAAAEHVDLSQEPPGFRPIATKKIRARPDVGELRELHQKTQGPGQARLLKNKESDYSFATGTEPRLSFLPSDKEDNLGLGFNDLFICDPEIASNDSDLVDLKDVLPDCAAPSEQGFVDEDEEMLNAALVGAADSQLLSSGRSQPDENMLLPMDNPGRYGEEAPTATDLLSTNSTNSQTCETTSTVPTSIQPAVPTGHQSMFVTGSSSTPVSSCWRPDPLPKRSYDDDDSVGPALQSSHFPSKRLRTTIVNPDRDESIAETANTLVPDNDVLVTRLAGSEQEEHLLPADSPRKAQLRAWVLAQFGDSIELF